MGMTNAHRVSLLVRAKRVNRAMRTHPYLALLVEGFMLFALVSLLRMPSAWANDGIEEWNDSSVTAEAEGGDGVHVEVPKEWLDEGLKQGAKDAGISEKEAKENMERSAQETREKNEQELLGKKPEDNKSDNNKTTKKTSNSQEADNKSQGTNNANGSSGQQGLQNPDALNVSNFMQRLDGIVTNFLMPVAVAWASWQLVYVALVCGLMGMDPLHVVNKQGDLTNVDVWHEVRNRFKNFAYGLAWIAGVWLIFEGCVFLVSNLVGILEARL